MSHPQYVFQRVAAAGGVVCVLMFFAAFALGGFIPPISPSLTAGQVAAHYLVHTEGIRLGGLVMMIGSMLYAPFTAVISAQMARIPGVHRAVRYTQLAAGAFASVTFLIPGMLFVLAAFRPERPAEETMLLNDLAWILLVLPWPPFFTQNVAFAFAILSDPRRPGLFPRWLAYFNVWAPLSFSPSVLLPFFKTGPFAWNGLFVVWIPAVVFIAQFVVNAVALFAAVGDEDGDVEGVEAVGGAAATAEEIRVGGAQAGS